MAEKIKRNMIQLITYKYKNKEINTPISEGFLTNFTRTKDWIEWLKKEFELTEEDFKKEQFNIRFKNETTQKEFMKLFYTNEEARKMPWGKDDDEEFKGMITWPPIWLHPIMEDTLNTNCIECGNKTSFDNRKIQEWFQEQKENSYDWEKGDNALIIRCKKCKFVGGIYKKCSYRICEEHDHGQGSQWWKDVWKKLGVNPYPDKFKEEKSEVERLMDLEEKSRSHK